MNTKGIGKLPFTIELLVQSSCYAMLLTASESLPTLYKSALKECVLTEETALTVGEIVDGIELPSALSDDVLSAWEEVISPLINFKGVDGRARQLTDKQRKALVILLSYPKMSMNEVGVKAGYANGPSASAAVASLLSLPHIQEFMLSQVKSGLVGSSISALHQLSSLSRDAVSERVRLDATIDILDRIGAREQPAGSRGPVVAIKIG